MPPPTELSLFDFGGGRHNWLVDAGTGAYRAESGEGAGGFATEVTTGLFRRQGRLVALYPAGETVILRIGLNTYDLGDAAIKIKKSYAFPFRTRAAVYRGAGLAEELIWWPFGADSDPWSADDIFDYVGSQFTGPGDAAAFAFVWNAGIRGEKIDSEEFQAKKRAYLAAKGFEG